MEPAHKRLRSSSSYNDEQTLYLHHPATTLTDYFSDDDEDDDDDQDKESVHSWQGYETGKPLKCPECYNSICNQSYFFFLPDRLGG